MKKEEIIALGIDEEVAKKIMAINGTDIENAKTKAGQATEKANAEIENLKTQLNAKDEQLVNVNSEIEKFKGMNIEEIQKQVETLKTQNAEFETKSKADKEAWEKQLSDQQYDFAVKEYLGTQKFTSDFTKNAFMEDFKKQQFKLGEDGKFLGADDYIKQFSEKNTGVFAIEEAPKEDTKPSYDFVAPTGGQAKQENSNGFNFNFTPVRKI